MNIYYDTEFIEFGGRNPILPLSIGMVRDDGAEYYAVFDNTDTLMLASRHDWLRANVLPYLPASGPPYVHWDDTHPDFPHVKHLSNIRAEIEEFVLGVEKPSLWAWYAAYDHVVLSGIFGRMIDLPEGFPMWTNDLKQEARAINLPHMPGIQEHNALSDAREVRYRYHWLEDSNWDFCPCAPDGESQCKVI
jgi:hypothetical protein